MKKANTSFKTVVITFLIVVLFGCSKKMDRYEDPKWLGGTNIETLEKAGNFTIYLQLMEKAGFKNTIEKQLTTLFVPNDDAFKKYFQKRGITSVNDLSEDEALELFTLHYIANPVNANHLVYEKAWNRLESDITEYRSLFFRKLTSSISVPYKVIPKYDPTYKDKELFIYTGQKYVPLFSKYYFQDYNGDAEVDYPMMYPESKWGGLMQWHNATMISKKENSTDIEDLANPSASGFIYYLDQVVDPMPSVEQYLIANQNEYSLFYDLMQRFATYSDAGTTDRQGRRLYTKGYSDISNIAAERGGRSGSNQQPDWALTIFTVFMPNNDLLQAYLDNTVLKSYSSISEVPDVTIRYILQSQITNRLELKSKFTKEFYNYFGDKSVINAADVEPGFMCSNGMVYKSKRILEPNTFLCVLGQLFFNKDYSAFMTMLTNTNMVTTLSTDREVTVFAPNNEQLLAANVRLTLNDAGVYEFQQLADDGQWKIMSTVELTDFAQDHIYDGKLTDLSGEGYIKMFSKNYVHYSNGVLSGGLNTKKGVTATVVGKNDSKNGPLYYIDQPIQTKYRMGQYIMNDPNLSEFAKLMVDTKMMETAFEETDTKNKYPNIAITEASNAYYWTAFIPDNAAMTKAKNDGIIPTDAAELKSFVDYHFIQATIFDDGLVSGSFKTLLGGKSLNITNNKNDLKITDATGQIVSLNHSDANNVVRRGVVHKISSVLKNK